MIGYQLSLLVIALICGLSSTISAQGTGRGGGTHGTGQPDNEQAENFWSAWSTYSDCSVTCGKGVETRTRKCIQLNQAFISVGAASSHTVTGSGCDGETSEKRPCEASQCPVDGMWGAWTQFNKCSASCGGGSQSRSRQCDSPLPAFGGAECVGRRRQEQRCNEDVPCPVDGMWGVWTQFHQCTASCGGGSQSRSRQCDSPAPAFGGATCTGANEQEQGCNDDVPCPVDGLWGVWTQFNQCSVSCGGGSQSRSRQCDSPAPAFGGATCTGTNEQEQGCNDDVPCPVDGMWGVWTQFNQCSVSCGGGSQSRSRQCDSPAPALGGADCVGRRRQEQGCNGDVPCPVDGMWGTWGPFSQCSASCAGGSHSRTRLCDSPAPDFGGANCVGARQVFTACNQEINCGTADSWGQWSPYSDCSSTCTGGSQRRTRICGDELRGCVGPKNEEQSCNDNIECQSVPEWQAWSQWSSCSPTCPSCPGCVQARSRDCETGVDGDCAGEADQERNCDGCTTNDTWGQWSPWSPCTSTCEGGKQSRSRICQSVDPQVCDGPGNQQRSCNDNVMCPTGGEPPVDGGWTRWTQWSDCSVTCGRGERSRVRACSNPEPMNGGVECPGPNEQTNICRTYIPCFYYDFGYTGF